MTSAVGLILAGGRAQRLGGHGKANLMLGGRTLLDRAIARLAPQCSSLLLNLPPGSAADYDGIPVVKDGSVTFEGPLSGLLAGLDWIASNVPDADLVMTIPVDSPFLPDDLGSRLGNAYRHSAGIVTAASAGRTHPLHAVWPVALREQLRTHLKTGSVRKVSGFQADHGARHITWDVHPVDPFFNINTAEDLATAGDMFARLDRQVAPG